MAETMDIPGIGNVPRTYVYVGGAVVVGIVGYAWFTREPEIPVEYPVDEGDIGDGDDSYENPAPGGSTVPSEPTDPELLPPTTNADWFRRAVAYLESIGYEASTVSAALGRYLDRRQLTSAQADIVRQAIGAIGPVPVGTYFILVQGTTPTTPKPTTPKPTTPKPTTPKPTTPKPRKPPTRSRTITSSLPTLSQLVAAYNRQYRTSFSWSQIWNFNLRWRSADTVATMRRRGPNLVYRGTTFWFPTNPADINK
ncbi:hypothetical protein E1265_21355 [Streptomyces sp. 8K308]|uniref:hypothetical protein n=1 Tax=Streptomyces sp. 8K308 TaxID=2530388 RepID=UPI00104E2E9B|nr:hypothetical protein [Streptomyces sp. 8K308]TDC20620.1 hypothetical protein E1265_21355 [Streptomyces sp. 8K308]